MQIKKIVGRGLMILCFFTTLTVCVQASTLQSTASFQVVKSNYSDNIGVADAEIPINGQIIHEQVMDNRLLPQMNEKKMALIFVVLGYLNIVLFFYLKHEMDKEERLL